MKFSLSLLDKNSEIRSEILKAMKEHLESSLTKTINYIEPKIRILVRQAIHNEPEYSSLISGDLRKEFGIADVSNVDVVINKVINSMNINKKNIKINNSGLSGGITLTIVPSDFAGIIDNPSAFVIDNERGYSLPWLEWLLLKGGEIIVRSFEVEYGSNPKSRSGEALMVSSSKNWRVPAQFSGTIRNNWITRALSTTEDKILQIIRSGLENSL
jgi:hypothetical protein